MTGSGRGCWRRRPRCGGCWRSRWCRSSSRVPCRPTRDGASSHYFAELDARFEERFDPGKTWAAERMGLTPPSGAFLIARVNGQPAGCGALRTLGPGVGEIARMWVDRAHRGLGIGRRLLEGLEEQAVGPRLRPRAARHQQARYDEAKAMYRSSGYDEIARYSDNPYADHWFEKRLAPARRAGGARVVRPDRRTGVDVGAERGPDGIRDRPARRERSSVDDAHGHDLGSGSRQEQLVGGPHVDRGHRPLVARDAELVEQAHHERRA